MHRRNVLWGVRITLIVLLTLIFILVFTIPTKDKSPDIEQPCPTSEVLPTTVPELTTEVVETTIEETEVQETVPETSEVTETTSPPETVAETEFVSFYSYTEEELDLLARLIDSEGGSESYDTKLKIGSVVMNRVDDPSFPNTIQEVIYQKSQFSVTILTIDGIPMIDYPADEESYLAARQILDYGSVLPSTVQVFYAYYCNEPWVTSRVVYERSDNTIFAHIYGG